MSEKLKPCPFCGSSIGLADTKDAAIKAWNRRALEAHA